MVEIKKMAVADLEKIKYYLSNLNSLRNLRDFLAYVGYRYVNQEILISDEDLSKQISIIKIAESPTDLSFPVLFVQADKPTDGRNPERYIRGLTRKIYQKLPHNLRTSLMIFSFSDFSLTHFVYAKQLERRVIFRRFIIAQDEKIRTACERLALILSLIYI